MTRSDDYRRRGNGRGVLPCYTTEVVHRSCAIKLDEPCVGPRCMAWVWLEDRPPSEDTDENRAGACGHITTG